MLHPWNRAVWHALGLPERQPPAVLLLSGPSGLGKAQFALHLAQALLCQSPTPDGEGCDDCQSCRLLSAGNHPDYRLVEAGEEAANADGEDSRESGGSRWIRVEQVRALSELMMLTPHLRHRRVVVIQAADRLHVSAANALLKTLEEPPNATHFLLVSSSPRKLPATILSRCVRLNFTLPGAQAAIDWLAGNGAAQPALALAQAGHAPLKAQALDAPEYWTKRKRLIEQVLQSPDFDPVSMSERMTGPELGFLVGALQRWCHDLILVKAAGQVRYNPDCAQILHQMAAGLAMVPFMAFVRDLQSTARYLEHPLNPRLVAERCLIGYKRAVTSRSEAHVG